MVKVLPPKCAWLFNLLLFFIENEPLYERLFRHDTRITFFVSTKKENRVFPSSAKERKYIINRVLPHVNADNIFRGNSRTVWPKNPGSPQSNYRIDVQGKIFKCIGVDSFPRRTLISPTTNAGGEIPICHGICLRHCQAVQLRRLYLSSYMYL